MAVGNLPTTSPSHRGRPASGTCRGGRCVWVAVWCWLMALVPVVSSAFGGLAGFGVLMAALALAVWRIDRWCAKQYWAGLREYKM